jgi:hypothetical protein
VVSRIVRFIKVKRFNRVIWIIRIRRIIGVIRITRVIQVIRGIRIMLAMVHPRVIRGIFAGDHPITYIIQARIQTYLQWIIL